MEDKTLNRLIEYCEEYSIESLTKSFQDKINELIDKVNELESKERGNK